MISEIRELEGKMSSVKGEPLGVLAPVKPTVTAIKMTEKSSHICTKCHFIGTPRLSVGRLFIEFFINLFISSSVPIFEKIRHCPDCGTHSMVSIASEAGENALAARSKEDRGGA
jgi:hypothetical protein